MPDLHLAQGRQHGADVLEEGRVGADDEDALAGEAVAVGIEEPRGAVQADGRLAGPGRALDADGRAVVDAHQQVLLGLDRGHDVAHGTDARALDLAGEDLRARLLLGAIREVLVLEGGDATPVQAEPAAQGHAHGLGPGGAVERGRHWRPPVDDERVAGVVGDVASADIPALAVVLRVEVDPAEEQGGRGVVLERAGALPEGACQVLRGDRVAALHVDGEGALAHGGELGAGPVEVSLLGQELGVEVRVAGRGHDGSTFRGGREGDAPP